MRVPFALVKLALLLGCLLAANACTAGRDGALAEPFTDTGPEATGDRAALARSGIDVPARGKFIVVNIPSFELVAVKDGQIELRSRVIVGRPATPTPELATAIEAVKFNPSWTPTAAMMRREGARPVPPGPDNPLGRVLFELDNDQLIFMHDTNDRSYFERSQRAFSHGCIRVQQARALAAWVLDLTEAEIDAAISRAGTRRVGLPRAVPVAMVYRTRFPDETGQLVDYPDIYSMRSMAGTATATSPGNCVAHR